MKFHAVIARWLVVLTMSMAAFAISHEVTPAVAQAQVKIVYVDLQRALNEVEDGKRAKAKLKKMFDERQKQLDVAQKELKAFQEEIKTNIEGKLWNEETQRTKMGEYQKKFVELQSLYVQLQRELAEAEGKETKKILDKFEKLLAEIGKENKYTLILEKTESSILWAPSSLDITDVLIQRYNTK